MIELVERAEFLASLNEKFDTVVSGEGHCVFVTGEAGIGKTSLVKAFASEKKAEYRVVMGSCDALFTPRPLAPLYDIAAQLPGDLLKNWNNSDLTALFGLFFNELCDDRKPLIIIIEDIHWADEATLDLIKFMGRRISLTNCLLIITYRDNEIHTAHPLRSVLGQLPPRSFSRLPLQPFSKETVNNLAANRGLRGEEVYHISGGNPFYVTEILASYSPGVPDNIKDAVLSVFHLFEEDTKRALSVLSVSPMGIKIAHLEILDPAFPAAIENCLSTRVLQLENGIVFFKHELYRLTIEGSLSPLIRIRLNKQILEKLLVNFDRDGEIERIVHHARNANAYDIVTQYAPVAAKTAALLGAHIEAAKLYYTTLVNYQGNDKNILLGLYINYAYECYLTNQTKEAINYQSKVLEMLKESGDREKIGDCLRFLSRLWWFEGNRIKTEYYAQQAIDVLNDQPDSRVKAMVFSNMSQLKMLSNEVDDCVFWGEKAIRIANNIRDDEALCHALNNVGTAQIPIPELRVNGLELLKKSLDLALKNSFHEHAARAFTNLGSVNEGIRDYAYSEKIIGEGIAYCQQNELWPWSTYMSTHLARIYMITGRWEKAKQLASELIDTGGQSPVTEIGALVVLATLKMRNGESGALPLLLQAKNLAFETNELMRIVPVLIAIFEYEWLNTTDILEGNEIDATLTRLAISGTRDEQIEFEYWRCKKLGLKMPENDSYEGFNIGSPESLRRSATYWKNINCRYQQALILFEGIENDKKEALSIMHSLGADAVYEKMKREMREAGIKNIPRGIRNTTRSNRAHLTEREIDVLRLLKEGLQNKEIAERLFISAKTVDHHISAILFKLDVNSRVKAVNEAIQLAVI